jgi:hypothetical protein
MSIRTLKIGIVSGVAGVSLLAGGLLFGGSLVSAQEPTPTPQSEEQAPDDSRKPNGGSQGREGCDKDGDGQHDGSSSGTSGGLGFRGGPGSLRQ